MWISKTYEQLEEFAERVKESFTSVKQEMDDHRESINRNTEEIRDMYAYLSEVGSKLDKLSERLDQVEMVLDPDAQNYAVHEELSAEEQEVFMALYTSDSPVSVDALTGKTRFREARVKKHICDLLAKGVPLERECRGEELYFSLDDQFKEIQAKNNVLDISESVAKELRA